MKIAMIGTGSMGSGLGRALAAAGHEVTMGSRDRRKAQDVAKDVGAARGTGYEQAAADAEVVFLAVPWLAVEETLAELGDVSGKTLVDVTNPYGPTGLIDMGDSSSTEEVGRMAPGARVVKGWNTVYARNLAKPDFDGVAASVFICSDDYEAKQTVMALARDIGFDPVDCGSAESARGLTQLLGVMGGFNWGRDAQLRLLRR
jgi:NADPH-dependent F420 reductase